MSNIKDLILGKSHIRLAEQSASITDVFTKTIKSLREMNDEVEKEVKNKEEAIRIANEEKESLLVTKEKNIKFITKLESIFE